MMHIHTQRTSTYVAYEYMKAAKFVAFRVERNVRNAPMRSRLRAQVSYTTSIRTVSEARPNRKCGVLGEHRQGRPLLEYSSMEL